MSASVFIARFRKRELLNRAGLEELNAVLSSISSLEEFQSFYGECARIEDVLDAPFINRNLISSQSIWQSHFGRVKKLESEGKDQHG